MTILKKIFIFFIFVLLLSAVIVFLSTRQKVQNQKLLDNQNKQKIDIAVSIYPIAYFVQKVAGDLVTVHLITPGAVEPHEYEPSPNDIQKIESSRAFVYNGAGIDVWADRIAKELPQKRIQVLKMSDHMVAVSKENVDPHFWLDPVLVEREIQSLVQLLEGLDPAHKDLFEKNAAQYLAELLTLNQEYKKGLENCRVKDIISSHDAFSYLAKRYNFTVHSIVGISPEAEPSAAHFAELSRLVAEKNIRTIFFESLVSPKLSEALATETGTEVAVLNPIEGLTKEEDAAKKNYDILMKENLAALRKSMLCQ